MPKLPDFRDPRFQDSKPDSALAHSILDGKGRSMRPMKEKLGSVDVAELVLLLRAFRNGGLIVPEEPDETPADAALAQETPHAPSPGVPSPSRAPAAPPAGRVPGRAPVAASPSNGSPAGEQSRTHPAQPARAADLERRVQSGRKQFQQFCAKCHGNDGRGAETRALGLATPNFANAAWHEKRTDSQLGASILDGRGTQMPAFRDKLALGAEDDLVLLVRSLCPTRPAAATAAPSDFEKRFQKLEQELGRLRREVKK